MKNPIVYSIALTVLAFLGMLLAAFSQGGPLLSMLFALIFLAAIFCLWYFYRLANAAKAKHDSFAQPKRAFFWKQRKWKALGFHSLFLIAFVSLVVFLYYAFESSPYNKRFDFSEDAFFSLSERSKKASLLVTEPISIDLYDLQDHSRELKAVLESYARENPNIQFRFVDLLRNLEKARSKGINSETSLVFEKISNPNEAYVLLKKDLRPLSGSSQAAEEQIVLRSYQGAINRTLITMFSAEKNLTLYVFSSTKAALDDSSDTGALHLRQNLQRLGFQIINLIPAQAETKASFLKRSKAALQFDDLLFLWHTGLEESVSDCNDFFSLADSLGAWHAEQGGSFIVLAPPASALKPQNIHVAATVDEKTKPCQASFTELFFNLPLRQRSGQVVDPQNFHPILAQRLQQHSSLLANYPLPRYGKHPIVEDFKNYGVYPFLVSPGAFERKKTASSASASQFKISPLLESSPYSWLEQNYAEEIKRQGQAVFQKDRDIQGSQMLALALEYPSTTNSETIESAPQRAVFIAEGRFALNALLKEAANNDFLMNAFLWTSSRADLLTSDYQRRSLRFFQASPAEALSFLVLAIVAWPLAIFSTGFVYLIYRNRRSARL